MTTSDYSPTAVVMSAMPGNLIQSRLGQMEGDFARRRAPHDEIILGRGLRAISFDVEAFPDWEQQVFLPGQL
jgi:hypothetical protein